MARRACDGDGLLGAMRAAVANLEAHVDEVNALNVYPVPDGDTGSNMLATVRASLLEAESSAGQPADRIAAAISFGALMGARGNSGVITSQIFRGMAEGMAGKTRFNGLDLAHALTEGARTAYRAVAKPVEGTILTVIRESAEAAVVAAELDDDIEAVLAATVAAAEKSVARTPTLLDILRDAGVVDSGGQGLFRLLQGAHLHLAGRAPARAARTRKQAAAGPKPSTLVAHADDGFGYETMFLLQPNGLGMLDVDAIRDQLEEMGEFGARRGRCPGAQGSRPQRPAGPGDRLRADSGCAQPDQRREPRPPGARRSGVEGGRIHRRRAGWRRDRRRRGADGCEGFNRRRRAGSGRHDRGPGDRCRRGRRRGRSGRDLPRLRGCRGRRRRTVEQPEHRAN